MASDACELNSDDSASLSPVHSNVYSPPPREYTDRNFILKFEKLPILWDTTHEHYTNKYKRRRALENLLVVYKVAKPHATVEDVKKKINTIRSNYRRELKKFRANYDAEDGERYVSKWWSFPYLHFLDKSVKSETQEPSVTDNMLIKYETQRSPSQENDLQEIENESSDTDIILIKYDNEKSPSPENDLLEFQNEPCEVKRPKIIKRSFSHERKPMRPMEKMKDDQIKEAPSTYNDDAQIFGNFVASALRNLRCDSKFRLMKRKIQAAIIEVENLEEMEMMDPINIAFSNAE